MNTSADKIRSPWTWVPTLYFFEGLPYFIVNTISILIFKDLGMSNGRVALLTSLIGLPWMIKPLWSPFVDIFRSKRWWILVTQILMAATVLLLGFTLPLHEPFTLTLILFVITGFASATHDISADGFYMIGLDRQQQSVFVGIRNTFYRVAMVFGQGVLVVIAGLIQKATVGVSLTVFGRIPQTTADILQHDSTAGASFAWSLTLIIASLILTIMALYHLLMIPRTKEDENRQVKSARQVVSEFGGAFGSFFTKPGIWMAMAFMLLYRLPEAFSVKMLYPFFSDAPELGGLGLDKETFGLVYGTAGVIALLAGGILGGIAISRRGLRKCLMPMALSLALPCVVYLILALTQTTNVLTIGSLVVLDQFGYGFGFTAYTVYMMRFSEGPLKTSHYAICTGFMALSMLLPGLVAGYLQELLGYIGFFIMVMVCCVATIGITLLAARPIEPDYGCRKGE